MMQRSTFLFIAFILCGLITKAQTSTERLNSIKQQHEAFVLNQEANKPQIKAVEKKKFLHNDMVEEFLLDSIYQFQIPAESDEYLNDKHFITYDDHGRETVILKKCLYPENEVIDTALLQIFIYDENNNLVQESQLNYYYDMYAQMTMPSLGNRNSYTYDAYNNQSIIITEYYEYGWVFQNKYINRYEANGNITNREKYYWDYENWAGTYRDSTTYDAAGNIIEEFQYEWNVELNGWDEVSKFEYIYNENGDLATTNHYEYTVLVSKANYTFDVNNLPTELIEENWDTDNEIWKNSQKNTFTYNANNLLAQEYEMYWEEEWVNSFLYTYTYESADVLINKHCQTWNNEAWEHYSEQTWEYDDSQRLVYQFYDHPYTNDEKWQYAYNENGLPTLRLYQYFNESDSIWVDDYRYEWEYDANENITYYLDFYTEYGEIAYIYGSKHNNTYDANNLLITKDAYGYDPYSLAWNHEAFYTYTYDDNENVAEVLCDYVYSYMEDTREVYYFSIHEVVQAIGDNNFNSEISVYPNPTTNVLKFNNISENADISIYDLSGKQIVNQKNIDNQININYLKSGIYTIRIVDNSVTQTAKFVKQ